VYNVVPIRVFDLDRATVDPPARLVTHCSRI
jgi:hypothetical protein